MAVKCDPWWSESNGYCSDDQGMALSSTGERVPYTEVLRTLGINVPSANPPAVPKPKGEPFDLEKWIKSGYNAVYAALGFVMLLMLMSTMRGRR